MANATKELILKYFQSWQTPSDWEEMASCLADEIDTGEMGFKRGSDLVNFCKEHGTPWKDVKLRRSLFTEDGGCLFYEGVNTVSGAKMRVAEHLTVEGGKIKGLYALIAPEKNNFG